ncbi:OsmC family protein [Eubacteriaceae bacterium ES3]|nr:OsmC family protein [Eubacteriaceae bacterium ES3]
MPSAKFCVRANSENPTKTTVKARGFNFIVDEPDTLGGTNEGLSPVEYLLGAFAGCLNVVGHLVAKEMNFELRGLKLEMRGEINTDNLMGVSNAERPGFQSIDVVLIPDCDIDSEAIEKWAKEVKARCPISDNLSNPTPVALALK